MVVINKPHEIARAALRTLATRKIAPTPDNYRKLYAEIAGDSDETPLSQAENGLRQLAADFPDRSPEQADLKDRLVTAAAEGDWHWLCTALSEYLRLPQPEHLNLSAWSTLLRELLRMTQAHHRGLTGVDKQAEMEAVLSDPGDFKALQLRLQQLVSRWSLLPPAVASEAANDSVGSSSRAQETATDQQRELRGLLAQALEQGVAARLIEQPGLAAETQALALRLREPIPLTVSTLRAELKSLWLKIELQGNVDGKLQEGLLQLLRLLVENVGELVMDDDWLRGQIAIVREAISKPLTLEAIEQAETKLQNVIFKQSMLKQSLGEAKALMKQMVASFIEQLGELSASTGDYHDTIESLAQQIRQTEDIGQLSELIDEVMRETRSMQASTLRARNEVLSARQQVDNAERKIRELESDLAAVSTQVREDHLTGALNRRGLTEAFERELATVQRRRTPLSIALLDIDNFKDLNDTYGHQTGDGVLAQLADLIRKTVRPTDIVARFGGEEFLILLPDSDTEQATSILVRLQRELTKTFFLHENDRLLITFSAGIASCLPGETQAEVIKRADQALYRAKRSGKNRVMAVEPTARASAA